MTLNLFSLVTSPSSCRKAEIASKVRCHGLAALAVAGILSGLPAEGQWTDAGTYIRADNAPNVVVTDSGRVGIGTTNPLNSLHVAGDFRLDLGEGLLFYGNTNFWGENLDSRHISLIDGNGNQAVVDGGLVIETYTSLDNFRLPLMTVRHNALDATHFGFGAIYPEHLFSVSSTWTLGAGKVDVSGRDVYGTNTSFLSTIEPGSEILISGAVRRVDEVLNDTHLLVAKPFISTSTQANHRYNRPLFWITEQGRVTIGTVAGNAGLDVYGPISIGGNSIIDDAGNWTGPSHWVDLTSNQAIDGTKTFDDRILAEGGLTSLAPLQIGDSANSTQMDIYSGNTAINFYIEGGTRYGQIGKNPSNNDFLLQASSIGKFRIANDLYLRPSDLASWKAIHAGRVNAYSDLSLLDGSGTTQGEFRLSGTDTVFDANAGSNFRFTTPVQVQGGLQVEEGMQVGSGLDVSGNLVLHPLPTGSASGQVCYNSNVTGDYLVKCSSSERLKKDIVPFGEGLSIVEKLRPVTYAWAENGQRDLGFVAEEVARVEPLLAAVSHGRVEGVRYDKLTAVLVKALQEQQVEILRQRAQIDGLLALLCLDRADLPVCSVGK